MKRLYIDSDKFDKNAVDNLGISELVLQENAARAVADAVRQRVKFGSKILAICGKGNNASDAIAALRMLSVEYECYALLLKDDLNHNAKIQLNIAKNVGVELLDFECDFSKFDCVVDGIFGSGFRGEMEPKIANLIEQINGLNALKIAVDMPSGVSNFGVASQVFKADFTICMGVLKLGLYSDMAKDFAGEIIQANLGLNESKFSYGNSDYLVLLDDLELPNRALKNVSKGDFGHAFIACGDMSGAAKISANSALKMGAGRVSVVNLTQNILNLDPQIILKNSFDGADAIAFGMGLGGASFDFSKLINRLCVVDADAFYQPWIRDFAMSKLAILTPHPKEFSSLLRLCEIGEFSVDEIQNNRFKLAREFSSKFPSILVLKGANVIIAKDGVLYVAPQGSAKLAVGGSGDALSGIILAYLANKFSPLKAAINGVLAHQKSAQIYKGNDYSFTPNDIIEGLAWL
ncbi:NAD(P)H-hydrate dehydratase [Campylobacter sp. CX2-4080-23]|uniref:NAD(P)H-hydrate dehydratase n=1 Tax=Campylobacter porcelli TaxID=1660073 RepID=UPI002EB2B96E|nr:NAD(P)H-hydrate dehydratase [Campylobacter sp. CX2-4080-23]